ncbi:MAG: DUF1732 domain-containing protein [Deltaproteobacteria bacterium]|nr:DUF1732 domain-containing protein [Deltaproteobacteria bacterium]
MMRSMTGYGVGVGEHDGVRATVEIRTLNHRHLDVRLSAPAGCTAAVAAVERAVRGRLVRGRVDVAIGIEGEAVERERMAAVVPAYRALERIRAELGVVAPIDLGAVFLAVTSAGVPVPGRAIFTQAVEAATLAALDQVDEMRAAEGAALRELLLALVDRMGELVASLGTVVRGLRERLPERLRARTDLLAQSAALPSLDQERLRQELAMLLDRADVTEESDRLACHVDHLRATLKGEAPAGRRGDFLAQEMLREAGTLAAKAQDAAVSRLAADLRALAEQTREQLQNVE